MKMSRRGNNEGCIYYRKDGRWCAQVSLDGRRVTKYGKTQKECRDWIGETIKPDLFVPDLLIPVLQSQPISYLPYRFPGDDPAGIPIAQLSDWKGMDHFFG